MGKPLSRKCKSCAKIFNAQFVRHAKRCHAGFTEWIFFDNKGNPTPKKELKRVPNRTYDATEGQQVVQQNDQTLVEKLASTRIRRPA